MKSSFETCLPLLLAHEGGFTNDPRDPGGPTNFGITICDYRKYVKSNATATDVRAMAIDDAKRIYRVRYWDAQKCDDLPAGIDYAVFDYGVNSGIARAGKSLRRLLGLREDSSEIDNAVIAAARAAAAGPLITAICAERLKFLKALRTWPAFGVGWARRVHDVESTSRALAEKAAGLMAPRAEEWI